MAHDRDINIMAAVGGPSDCPRAYTDAERKQGAGQRGEDFLMIESLRAALQEQVDECRDPTCEMCVRHQAILNRN